MKNYELRRATLHDVDFLATVIIEAERSMTDKLGLSTIFDLSEDDIRSYLVSMLEEEVDGCEISVSSFMVATLNGKCIAAFGGWIEGFYDDMPSSLLKSNLIGYTIPKDKFAGIIDKRDIIKGIQIEREMYTHQLEYGYVISEERGNGLIGMIMNESLKSALNICPELKKSQVQIFENNPQSMNAYEKLGYRIVRRFESTHPDILKYMPYNVKLLMEKEL